MRSIKFLSIFTLALFLAACDPCSNLDCVTSDVDARFRIIDKTNGTDLLFGPARIYDVSRIKLYSVNGSDTSFFYTEAIGAPGSDSLLYVRFFPASETAYLRYGNGDIDTLKISYDSRETKCCGTIKNISNFRFNNSGDIPAGTSAVELKK